jgi:hypothetical protein
MHGVMAHRLPTKIIEFALIVAIVAFGIAFSIYRPDESRYAFNVKIPPAFETEAGDRDLSLYEFGGEVPNCLAILLGKEDDANGNQCLRQMAEIRTFIEEHFKDHQRGYAIVDGFVVGSFGKAYVFVEPYGPFNEWSVQIRQHQTTGYTFNSNMNTFYYSEVFRRTIRKSDYLFLPGTSVLVLRSRGVYEQLL